MKKGLLYFLLCVIICTPYIHSQTKKDNLANPYSEKTLLSQVDNDIYLKIAEKVEHGNVSIHDIYNIFYKSDAYNKVLKAFVAENKRMPDAILFFSGINGKNEWQLYDSTSQKISKLIYGQSVAIICIDNLPYVDYQVEIKIDKLEPYLETEAKAIVSIFTTLFSPAKNRDKLAFGEASKPIDYFIKCDFADKISTPANVNVTIKQLSSFDLKDGKIPNFGKLESIIAITDSKVYFYCKTDITIKNIERRWIGFSIGVSYAQSSTTIIAPDASLNDINLLKVSKGLGKEWKGNAIFLISFYPGIETDYVPNNNIWRIKDFIYDFPKRLSLSFGFNINDKPFDCLYAGLGIRLNSVTDLVLGVNFTSSPQDGSTISLLKVSSFTDVSKIFPTKYESGIFFGLSVRILDMISLL